MADLDPALDSVLDDNASLDLLLLAETGDDCDDDGFAKLLKEFGTAAGPGWDNDGLGGAAATAATSASVGPAAPGAPLLAAPAGVAQQQHGTLQPMDVQAALAVGGPQHQQVGAAEERLLRPDLLGASRELSTTSEQGLALQQVLGRLHDQLDLLVQQLKERGGQQHGTIKAADLGLEPPEGVLQYQPHSRAELVPGSTCFAGFSTRVYMMYAGCGSCGGRKQPHYITGSGPGVLVTMDGMVVLRLRYGVRCEGKDSAQPHSNYESDKCREHTIAPLARFDPAWPSKEACPWPELRPYLKPGPGGRGVVLADWVSIWEWGAEELPGTPQRMQREQQAEGQQRKRRQPPVAAEAAAEGVASPSHGTPSTSRTSGAPIYGPGGAESPGGSGASMGTPLMIASPGAWSCGGMAQPTPMGPLVNAAHAMVRAAQWDVDVHSFEGALGRVPYDWSWLREVRGSYGQGFLHLLFKPPCTGSLSARDHAAAARRAVDKLRLVFGWCRKLEGQLQRQLSPSSLDAAARTDLRSLMAEQESEHQDTPLHLLVRHGRDPAWLELAEAALQLDIVSEACLLEAKTSHRWTFVQTGARSNNVAVVAGLLQLLESRLWHGNVDPTMLISPKLQSLLYSTNNRFFQENRGDQCLADIVAVLNGGPPAAQGAVSPEGAQAVAALGEGGAAAAARRRYKVLPDPRCMAMVMALMGQGLNQ